MSIPTLFEHSRPATRGPWTRRMPPMSNEDPRIVALQSALDEHGGSESGDHIAIRLERLNGPSISTIAKWIVRRDVLSYTARGVILLPLFQFDPVTCQPLLAVRAAVRELRDVFDDLELCGWFVQPNAWLQGDAPIARLRHDPDAVVKAARTDRYVALG